MSSNVNRPSGMSGHGSSEYRIPVPQRRQPPRCNGRFYNHTRIGTEAYAHMHKTEALWRRPQSELAILFRIRAVHAMLNGPCGDLRPVFKREAAENSLDMVGNRA